MIERAAVLFRSLMPYNSARKSYADTTHVDHVQNNVLYTIVVFEAH
jgi:hypothetical protein